MLFPVLFFVIIVSGIEKLLQRPVHFTEICATDMYRVCHYNVIRTSIANGFRTSHSLMASFLKGNRLGLREVRRLLILYKFYG
jgi:hypothetical protein